MARFSLASLSFLPFALSLAASADTSLPVVYDYAEAGKAASWAHVKREQIPHSLLRTVKMENPSRAFMAPYEHVFLQNSRMIVCGPSCDGAQDILPDADASGFRVNLAQEKHKRDRVRNGSIVRQATVYYWINRLFDRFEALGFAPEKKLMVLVDRQVENPTTGADQNNNAFFNDKDWSLSFLPAQNAWMVKTDASAYDPSVAMHEATHSVFQALIGQILNREILGLHEAFADYFSLAILESPRLGDVMMRGTDVRSAAKIIEYKPQMEAHDLGNVVSSALWKIRETVGNHDLSDKAALQTIVEVSRNPYALAGNVVSANLAALAAQGLSADKLELVKAVWESTKLKSSEVVPNIEVLKGPVDSSKALVTSFQLKLPQGIADSLGEKHIDQISLGLIDSRPGPAGSGSIWLLVSVDSASESTPIWILYSGVSKSILTAYDFTVKQIQPQDSATYAKLLELGDNLGDLIGWATTMGKEYRDLYNKKKGPLKLMYRPTNKHEIPGYVSINGHALRAVEHQAKLRRTFLNWIVGTVMGKLVGKEMKAQLRQLRSLTLITVATKELPKGALPEVEPGETLVGYRVGFLSGAEMTVLVQSVGK